MLEWYDWEIFFPLYQKEFFGDTKIMDNSVNMIADIGDDVWSGSPDKIFSRKRLKK